MKGQGYLASYDRIRKIKTWGIVGLNFSLKKINIG
jgi:hypothetical protein